MPGLQKRDQEGCLEEAAIQAGTVPAQQLPTLDHPSEGQAESCPTHSGDASKQCASP